MRAPTPRSGSRARSGSRVHVEGDAILATLPDGPVRLPIVEAPKKFTDWMDAGRRAMYEQIVDGSSPSRFFPQHLPMVVTYNSGSTFPFTCGNKGVGYLPRPEHLDRLSTLYRDTIEASKGMPWRDSLRKRIQAASQLNLNPSCIDRRCLSTIEIFERQTFQNLKKTPLASLLFTGHSPTFTSFQINCVVEVIGPQDPRHTFITLARTMFEYDDFHITQHNFPFAYVFWISECVSKTPFRVAPGPDQDASPPPAGSMPWHPEALASIGRAPRMVQSHIRAVVEDYARVRGFDEVTLVVLQEARENLMDGR